MGDRQILEDWYRTNRQKLERVKAQQALGVKADWVTYLFPYYLPLLVLSVAWLC
jgi:hypothetical protein